MKKRFHYIINFFITNNKLHTIAFFLLISTVFWLMTHLSESYSYTYKIPVRYIGENHVVLPDFYQHDTLKIKIQTTGYRLILLKLKKPVFQYVLDSKVQQKFWNPPLKKIVLQKLLGEDVKIVTINPKKLNLLKGVHQKIVEVRPKLKLFFAPSYKSTSQAMITPKKVMIYGDFEKLKSLDTIETQEYVFKNVRQTIDEKLKLDTPEGIISNPTFIHYQLPVDQVIEQTRKLNVFVYPEKLSNQIMTIPSKVTIKYRFFRTNYKQIKNAIFRAGIDFHGMSEQDSLVKVRLISKPKGIFDIEIYPEKIKIFIKR